MLRCTRWFWYLTVFVASGVLAKPAADMLAGEPALDEPITLHYHVVSLNDLVSEIRRQTGVYLETSAGVSDEKACIFIREKPAREVMNKLASVFLLRWEKRKTGGFRLVPDYKARRLEQDFLVVRQQVSDRLFLEWLGKAYRATQGGLVHLRDRVEKLNRELERRAGSRALAQEVQRLTVERDNKAELAGREVYAAVRVLGRSPILLWERLKRGETIIASTHPQMWELPLPIDIMDVWEGWGTEESQAPSEIRVVIFLKEEDEPLLTLLPTLVVGVAARMGTGWITDWTFIRPVKIEQLQQAMQNHDLVHRWNKWNMAGDGLKEQVSLSGLPAKMLPYPRSGEFGWMMIVGDYLCWFSQYTGLPVIADGYRTVIREAPPADAPVPANWLNAFAEKLHYWVRYEDGYVLARSQSYVDERETEIPERLLRPLEEKAARGDPLSIDDYSRLAAWISHRQKITPPVAWAPCFVAPAKALRFPAGSALLLPEQIRLVATWEYLTPQEKRMLLSGETVHLSDWRWRSIPPLAHEIERYRRGRLLTRPTATIGELSLQMEASPSVVLSRTGRAEWLVVSLSDDDIQEGKFTPDRLPTMPEASNNLLACRGTNYTLVVRAEQEEVLRSTIILRDEPLLPLDVSDLCGWNLQKSPATTNH